MKITVFGASGRVGRLLTAELLRRGHQVTAFTHSNSLMSSPGLSIVKGDIADRQAVTDALRGSQAVASALGSWKSPDKNVVSTAFEKIVSAMKGQGVRRVVSLTGSSADLPAEKRPLTDRIAKAGFNMIAPKILRDAEDHLAQLAASGLDWTVVRSPAMTKGKSSYKLAARPGSFTIPRQAVAVAMADLLENGQSVRQAPIISRG